MSDCEHVRDGFCSVCWHAANYHPIADASAVGLIAAGRAALAAVETILYTSRHDTHHVDGKDCQACRAMLIARAEVANIDRYLVAKRAPTPPPVPIAEETGK